MIVLKTIGIIILTLLFFTPIIIFLSSFSHEYGKYKKEIIAEKIYNRIIELQKNNIDFNYINYMVSEINPDFINFSHFILTDRTYYNLYNATITELNQINDFIENTYFSENINYEDIL
jgi:hypothetical protein